MKADQAGVPAVGVMTSAFVDAAELMATVLGATGFPFAVIDHPIANASPEALSSRARDAVEQAVRIWCGS